MSETMVVLLSLKGAGNGMSSTQFDFVRASYIAR